MIYHTHKSTGLELSAIGFGGMRFQDQNDVEGSAALVKAAYDAGINYFDTAIGYGKSEDLFGAAFKEMKKARAERPFYVSTKTFANTPQRLREEVERSLTRMGLEYIDFYHFWCIKSMDEYAGRKGILEEFAKLKEEGLVRHVAVSSHMTGAEVGEMLRDYPFESVLFGYSAMNFLFREAGLQAAADLGLGVIAMNPLGGGIIPQNPELFSFLKTQDDETTVEAALRFLLNDKRITTSIVGFSTLDHLREAIRAVDGFQPISNEKMEEIRSNMTSSFDAMCTGCQYCKDCPVDLPVPKLMDTYNQYMITGDKQSMVNRLRWHWSLLNERDYFEQCIECGACEAACTQHLPIIERIKEVCEVSHTAATAHE